MKLLNALPPYNLFGIEEQDYKRAKVVAIPVPYDSTSTYKAGSREGPRAIIEASRNMELYSDELEKDVSKRVGIFTTDEMAPDFSSPDNMVKRIEREVDVVVDDGKVPMLLGGEHTISVGAMRSVRKKHDFSVLHFDAHSDSRDEYGGTKYDHACVMARAKEICGKYYSVGIRSIDEQGAKDGKGSILYMKEMHKMTNAQIVKSILKNTKNNIYLSIDYDVLDPSEMPSTGTPEPDGMRFRQLIDILKPVLKERKVVGLDFVELNPIPGMVAPNYLAAKLIYITLGYAFA
ncbi:MAG: agmatinase [Candidatus Micrarchaeota archaeon]|nr:agmatinase [Candidatus Micrarchaeota archaeon]